MKTFSTLPLITLCVLLSLSRQRVVAASHADDVHLQQLLRNLNTSVDPCEDFYAYVCGNWAKSYNETASYLDAPGYMDQIINEKLLHILRRERHNGGIYSKLWQHYVSCEQLTKPALNHYLRLVQPELDFTWPILRTNWTAPWPNATQFDWLRTIAVLRTFGLNGEFLSQHVNARLSNGSYYLIQLHPHQPRKHLHPAEVQQILKDFGLSTEERADIGGKLLNFSTKLSELGLDGSGGTVIQDSDNYTQYFQEFNMNELLTRWPQLEWLKYFRIVLGRELAPDREVVQTFALDEKYFDELTTLLSNTENQTICNYLMFKFMYQLSEQLPAAKNKSLICVKHLRGHMPLAMNFLYEEHCYKTRRAETDAALQRIFDRLRANFALLLAENRPQLDEREKAYILGELRNMRLKIGNIPTTWSRAFVEQYYANITLEAHSFYENHLLLLKHTTYQQQRLLSNQPVQLAEQFYEHDAETASSSSPVKVFDNVILVPYGFLQPPLYTPQLSELYQYSLFGFILAHEIMHAYDMFHIAYDQYGNYNDLGIHISQHYGDYINCTAQNPHGDSFSENLADIVGLRLAYRTYFDDVANSLDVQRPPLAGNLTSQQMFFVNSAQFLCANMPQIDGLNVSATQLGHDLHDVRVRQNWANFERFSDAFACEIGAVMHPVEHCRLW